jgi:hypothetical protein
MRLRIKAKSLDASAFSSGGNGMSFPVFRIPLQNSTVTGVKVARAISGSENGQYGEKATIPMAKTNTASPRNIY